MKITVENFKKKIIVTYGDGITAESIFVSKPSWFARLLGITWESRVRKAILYFQHKEAVINKLNGEVRNDN